MIVYSHNDPLMCFTFPFSLKGMALNWFYSLAPQSLHNFKEMIEAFLFQYASRREANKKMRYGGSLKSYISFFQIQLAKVPNCDRDIFALAFIVGLQVSYPQYKYLLKHNIR